MLQARPNLYESAESLSRDPSVRIVGSLARSAIMGIELGETRDSGVPRNFNAFHVMPENYQMFGEGSLDYQTHELSTRFDQWIRTEQDGTSWLVFPAKPESVAVELKEPEEVLRAHHVTLDDYDLTTPVPEVLGRINRLMHAPRPKDKGKFETYDAFIADQPAQIHPDLLRPFDYFDALMARQKMYNLKVGLRSIYHRSFDERMRKGINISRYATALAMVPHFSSEGQADDRS